MTDDEIRRAELDIVRAEAARQILDSDIFKEAFEHIEGTITARWKTTQVDDTTGRERAFAELRLVNAVRGYFTSAIGSGIVARDKLTMLEKIKRGIKW